MTARRLRAVAAELLVVRDRGVDDMALARLLLASVRFVADETLPDDRVYTMPPRPGAFWRGEDNRTVLLGSTRALGALAAYSLAARHRPEGVP